MGLTNKQITVIFKALCDENRVQIFRLLQGGEHCTCHLLEEMNLSQPTLSHHMKILSDSGLVVGRKEGKWMHYSISAECASNTDLYEGGESRVIPFDKFVRTITSI